MREVAVRIGRRAMLAGLTALGGCGWLMPDELQPVGFGAPWKIPLEELETHFGTERFLYVPQARAWVVQVDEPAAAKLALSTDQSLVRAAETGYLALFQKCPHLGCRVPSCESSGLFECPCHGSKYTRFGEKLSGPAPRGMDRFATTVEDDHLVIRSSDVIQGPPIGFNASGEDSIGPFCIGEASH